MFGITSPKKDGPAERLQKHVVKCNERKAEQVKRMSTLDALNAELKKAVSETAQTAVSIVNQLNGGNGLAVKKSRRKKLNGAIPA